MLGAANVSSSLKNWHFLETSELESRKTRRFDLTDRIGPHSGFQDFLNGCRSDVVRIMAGLSINLY